MNIMLILDFTDVSELFLFWNNWIYFDFLGIISDLHRVKTIQRNLFTLPVIFG